MGRALQRKRVHRGALVVLWVVCGALFTGGASAHAATLSFNPASGSFPKNQTFPVRVMVDGQGATVNASDGTVTFDTTKLSVVSVSKDGSAFSLWATEPTFNNSAGTVSWSGGSPSPVSGTKPVVTITFRGSAEGAASVSVKSATVLAADGKGTDVYKAGAPASYTISAPAATPPPIATPTTPPKEERKINIPPPEAPKIKSTTHKDEALWSKETTAKFSWDIPYGVTIVKIGFDDKPAGEPTEKHEPPISEFSKEGIADGVWYFHASYSNRGGYGPLAHYKIMVDTTPPKEFSVSAEGGDLSAQLRFAAEDELSGIEVYKVGVDDGKTRDVRPDELTGGTFSLTNLTPGERTVTVSAFDKAGNVREASAKITVTGTAPVAQTEVATQGGGSLFGAVYWVSIILVLIIGALVAMQWNDKRKHIAEKDRIRREAMEVGEKLVNIFGVLREEIEEKVLELAHKPNMTDNERNILEGLKDALDISEELIDKEVEDVRKLLK